MKREMILVMWFLASFQLVFGQAEVRKPSVEVFVNGKMYQNGDEITVQKGQMLEIKALQKGGRRDFVNYPDNYLKITPNVQVLSRGVNRLIYLDKDVKTEWKLLSENAFFSSDNQLAIKKNPGASNEANVLVGVDDFSRTYLKINLSTVWENFTGDEQKMEKNSCEAFIYLNIAGSTDTWFVSKNIHVSGTKEVRVSEMLKKIQNNFDTIESNLIHFNYAQVQRDIRNLQASVNSLNEYLQETKANNPAFKIEIHFVGLPSDQPISDLGVLEILQGQWAQLNTFIHQQAAIINSSSPNNNNLRLKSSIQKYLDWQYSLPDNWLIVMGLYLPNVNTDQILVPSALQALTEANQPLTDSPSIELMKTFINQRVAEIENETQQIAQTKSRLQAVKLFDGMLRSYISSINWAAWENNREVGFAYAK